MESGSRHAAAKGPEQGNPASPAVASICMRCAIAQWFDIAFKKQCGGECGLALCAGDFAAAFQYRGGAYYFPAASAERFALSGLEPGQKKTRPAEFGKHAEKNRKTRGRKKPKETEGNESLAKAEPPSPTKGPLRRDKSEAQGPLPMLRHN
ncbi:MAG: hypothetical protein LBU32_06495 [Clostridiales bacterium]|jgi:hypothetical protein|nr:hypothetical protein [Clostridiales bacterium]